MRLPLFCFIFSVLAQHCVLVQIQKKDTVLARAEEKTETNENRKVAASLTALGFEDGVYKLVFSVRDKITLTERKYFHEKVQTENRLIPEGKSMRFFAGWLAFAYEDEGWGSYFLNILGGIPLTLGINVPIAVGDWLSIPFRLADEKSERTVKEEKKLAQSEEQADCSRFAVRISQAEYPLDAACVFRLDAVFFEELAARHAYRPKISGSFRYELVDSVRRETQMNSLILLREFPLRKARIEFIERP